MSQKFLSNCKVCLSCLGARRKTKAGSVQRSRDRLQRSSRRSMASQPRWLTPVKCLVLCISANLYDLWKQTFFFHSSKGWVKPLDKKLVGWLAADHRAVITVEVHHPTRQCIFLRVSMVSRGKCYWRLRSPSAAGTVGGIGWSRSFLKANMNPWKLEDFSGPWSSSVSFFVVRVWETRPMYAAVAHSTETDGPQVLLDGGYLDGLGKTPVALRSMVLPVGHLGEVTVYIPLVIPQSTHQCGCCRTDGLTTTLLSFSTPVPQLVGT